MSQLQVAVIGGGNLGKIHARLLEQQRNVNLLAVADPLKSVRDQISQTLDARTIDNYLDMVGHIDAAIVATPTRFHFDIASQLISHGIHVLVEKPLTDDVSTAKELVSMADRHNCVVQVGHVERFNPAFEVALKHVGKPRFIQASRASGYTFRSTDIGVVHDLMIHDIDLVNSMVGGSLVETRAIGFSMFGGNEDMAQARLQFSCGTVASLTASRCSYTPSREMQIFGTEGFANIDFTNSKVTYVEVPAFMRNREVDFFALTESQKQFVRESLFSKVLPKQEMEVERTNAILHEQADFFEAIRNGTSVRVSAAQGAQAVEVAQSVLDSISSHCWAEGAGSMTGPMPMLPIQSGGPVPVELMSESISKAA